MERAGDHQAEEGEEEGQDESQEPMNDLLSLFKNINLICFNLV